MPATEKSQTNRNIVLITVDCWRGDHVGANGNDAIKTPHIDQLASHSKLFSEAYTCGGWTKIAMTSLFSSTYSSQYNFSVGDMDEGRPLLAKTLQDAGYETAGMTTNLVCGAANGFDQGFEFFEDIRPKLAERFQDRLRRVRGMHRVVKLRLFRKFMASIGLAYEPTYPTVDGDGLVDRALDWLEQPHERPYFLWLHFMDLHWPYKSSLRTKNFAEQDEMWMDRTEWHKLRKSRGKFRPDDARLKRWLALYREECEMLDTSLGRLFDGMKARSDWNNTDIILTGDHGEEFYEHGTWGHSWNQLHREGAHVPLVMRLSGNDSGQSSGQPVSHIDIAPTILDRANVAVPEAMLGDSLLKEDCGEAKPVLKEMHGHAKSIGYRLSIIHQGHKYIYDGDRDTCHLFDLSSDTQELHDIYEKGETKSRHFDRLRLAHISTGVLDRLKTGLPVLGEDMVYDIDADPEVVERLRALGYLD